MVSRSRRNAGGKKEYSSSMNTRWARLGLLDGILGWIRRLPS